MKLIHVISKYTNANSQYVLHLPDLGSQPVCHSRKSFATEWVDGDEPTCQKCLHIFRKYHKLG